MKIGIADAMDISSDQEIFYIYHSAVARGVAAGNLESESAAAAVHGLLVIAYIIKIYK